MVIDLLWDNSIVNAYFKFQWIIIIISTTYNFQSFRDIPNPNASSDFPKRIGFQKSLKHWPLRLNVKPIECTVVRNAKGNSGSYCKYIGEKQGPCLSTSVISQLRDWRDRIATPLVVHEPQARANQNSKNQSNNRSKTFENAFYLKNQGDFGFDDSLLVSFRMWRSTRPHQKQNQVEGEFKTSGNNLVIVIK